MTRREAHFDAMLRYLGPPITRPSMAMARHRMGRARWDRLRLRTDAGRSMNGPAGGITAARLMNGNRIRRLPMVDPSGKLIGIVSRRDLLSVLLRPDEEIAADVHGVLTGILLEEPDGVEVTARNAVVTLSGSLAGKDLIPVAERLGSGVDGVVWVICKLTETGAASAGQRLSVT
jgi:CBS domain